MSCFLPGLKDLIAILVLMAVLVTADSLLLDSDIGWHVRAGEIILQTGSVPLTDPFSFSAAGQPWFPWEWLSDLAMATLHSLGGLRALVAASALLLALTFWMLLAQSVRLGAHGIAAFGICLLGASVSMVHWLARPHLLSYPFLLCLTAILEAGNSKRTPLLLWSLVPLVLLWCNLHGSFVVGLLVMGAYLVGGLRANSPRRWGSGSLLAVLVASSLATLATPFGWELHLHLFRYLKSEAILKNILEFRPPDFQTLHGRLLEGWLLLAAIALGPIIRNKDWPRLLVLLGLTHLTLQSHRHAGLLVVATAPFLAAALFPQKRAKKADKHRVSDSRRSSRPESARGKNEIPTSGTLVQKELQGRRPEKKLGGSPLGGRAAPCSRDSTDGPCSRDQGLGNLEARLHGVWGILVVLVITSWLAISPNFAGLWGRFRFSSTDYPVEAAAIISKSKSRRLFCTDRFGGYLIYRLFPQAQVFIDGRSDFYAETGVFQDYLSIVRLDPGWQEKLQRWSPDLAVLPSGHPLVQWLRQIDGWQMVHEDLTATVLSPPQ